MRVLGPTLTAAQLAMGDAKLRIVLSNGAGPYTYYIDSGDDRILTSRHTEQEWSYAAQMAIQDSDATLAGLDLRGYKGVIGYGYGANYSDCAPLWCIAQKTDSFGGGIVTSLSLAGTFNLMGEDRASAAYTPDTSNTDTVKTILTAVCEKTLAPFTHCTSYTATFDVSTGIIDTFMPKDGFRVYLNDTRLAVVKRLMKFVGYKCRVEADEQIHFFIPEDTTPEYEYEDIVTEHNFYEKGVRKRMVIPNYVVVSSHPDHEDPYKGWSGYKADTTNDGNMEIREHKYFRVTSDAQCVSIATNLLLHHQLDAERGHGFAPMNCGQEVFDYVKITDSRVGDTRSGNIGYINREYAQGKFPMAFRFGSVAPGQYLGTMPPQMTGISTAALAEQIALLWDNQNALIGALIETKQEVITLEPDAGIPSGGLEGGSTSKSIFDGSTDTPTSVTWGLEAGLPFTETTSIQFSPVIEEVSGVYVVYVVDLGTNFWKYNLTEKEWTKLTSLTNVGTNCYRTLSINPPGTKLACVSTANQNLIEIYTISSNTWVSSSAAPTTSFGSPQLRSMVWADNDTLWVWMRNGAAQQGMCIKYTVSTDTWTEYTNDTGVLDGFQARCCAINATGTIVYGGHIGDDPNSGKKFYKYTIATDTYATSGVVSGMTGFAWAYDKDKLWFVDSADYRQGYVDTADDGSNPDQFAENTDRTAGYGSQFGVSDDVATIIAFARSTVPELMSVITGGMYLLGTIYASGLTHILVEKPTDNYPVFITCTTTNTSFSMDTSDGAWVKDLIWKVYYPVIGDYTQVKVWTEAQ